VQQSAESPAPPGAAPSDSRATRWLFRAAGFLFIGLGAVGVVVPGLPTTPLVLVAAACFTRSSPRMHRWLLANRVFGPLIRNWQEHRSISPGDRRIAITMIVAVGVVTVGFLLSNLVLRIVVAATMLAVIGWLSRLPVRPSAE
jgi:uncharacterized membrane protein YbaN (DUF454 family)